MLWRPILLLKFLNNKHFTSLYFDLSRLMSALVLLHLCSQVEVNS